MKRLIVFLLNSTALIILGLFTNITTTNATHLMGGDLSYECLGNGDYRVTLTVYRDCNGINAGSTQTLTTIDNCGLNDYTMTKISSQEITPTCPLFTGSACNNGGGIYGVEEHIYQVTLNIPTSCSNITLSWRRCCRNGAINTLTNPLSERMFIETNIPNLNICNNSPTFLNNPVPFICANQPTNYNHGAVDPDGDDLKFSLISCSDDDNVPVIYSSGFNATTPLTTSTGITIDSLTGALSFTPTQQQVGVLCVLVEEYRNGIKISEIMRDIQFTVLTCSNDNPTASGIDGSGTFTTSMKVGNAICFDIFSNDIDTGDIVTMVWNNAISNASFSINTTGSYPVGTFCWTPTNNDIGTKSFTITVEDDNCPLVGMNTYTYLIDVSLDTVISLKNGAWNDPTTWDCNCTPAVNQNVIVNDTVTLNANYTLSEGAFIDVNTNAFLTIDNGHELNVVGSFNNSGKINGHVSLDGTMANFIRMGDVDVFEVNNPAGILLIDDASINSKLILTDGSLNTNGNDLTLVSNAEKTAMVVEGSGSVIGPVIYQRYLNNIMGFHYITSPVSDATVNELADDFPLDLNAGFPHLYYYDETDTSTHSADGWTAPSNTNHPMGVAEGYAAYFMAGSGITLDVRGQLNSGTINIPLSFTPNSTTNDSASCPPEGWNLIGNPYASPLNFDLVVQEAPPEMEHAIYMWDPVTKSYVSYVDGISSPAGVRPIIPAMQAFWVKVSDNTTLTLNNHMRVTDHQDTANVFYKAAPSANPLMRLELSGQNKTSEVIVRFHPNATDNYDKAYDAYYMPGSDPNIIELACLTADGPLTINSLPSYQSTPVEVHLYFAVSVSGTYTLDITEFQYFDPNDQIILEDHLLGTTHVLNNGSYTFTGDPNNTSRRFTLIINPALVSNVNQILSNDQIKVYKNQQNLVLEFPEANTSDQQILIYNQLGQLVHQTMLSRGQKTYVLDDLNLNSPSIYFVEIESIERALKVRW